LLPITSLSHLIVPLNATTAATVFAVDITWPFLQSLHVTRINDPAYTHLLPGFIARHAHCYTVYAPDDEIADDAIWVQIETAMLAKVDSRLNGFHRGRCAVGNHDAFLVRCNRSDREECDGDEEWCSQHIPAAEGPVRCPHGCGKRRHINCRDKCYEDDECTESCCQLEQCEVDYCTNRICHAHSNCDGDCGRTVCGGCKEKCAGEGCVGKRICINQCSKQCANCGQIFCSECVSSDPCDASVSVCMAIMRGICTTSHFPHSTMHTAH